MKAITGRLLAVAGATVLIVGLNAGTASAVTLTSTGVKGCPGKLGRASAEVWGKWSNRPPGGTITYTGDLGYHSGQVIQKIANVNGGGSWKMTSTDTMGSVNASCLQAV